MKLELYIVADYDREFIYLANSGVALGMIRKILISCGDFLNCLSCKMILTDESLVFIFFLFLLFICQRSVFDNGCFSSSIIVLLISCRLVQVENLSSHLFLMEKQNFST